jgi:16S rRNA (uracil1498-N3)-methyltransferase
LTGRGDRIFVESPKKTGHWEGHYCPPESISGSEIRFPAEEVRHLVFVLRKKKGDRVWAVDGLGGAYEIELVRVSKKEAVGKILRTERNIGESPIAVTLAAGVLKGERFDWLVEKATELGVRRIVPFISEGSVARPNARRVQRWRNIALAAMKQSGRSVLPEITNVLTFKEVIGLSRQYEIRIAAHPCPESVVMKEMCDKSPQPVKSVLLLVGPEGGFVQKEIDLLKDRSFNFVSLGPRRLRAETAGVVLISQFMMMAEE